MFWERIRQLQAEDVTVFVKVDSANKGGLLVKYGPYDGFVPVSQFGSVSVPSADGNAHRQKTLVIPFLSARSWPTLVGIPPCVPMQVVTVDMMDSLIGYEIPVKFLEVDEVGSLRVICPQQPGKCACWSHTGHLGFQAPSVPHT